MDLPGPSVTALIYSPGGLDTCPDQGEVYLPRNVWEQGVWMFSLESLSVPPGVSFWASDTGWISSGCHSKYHGRSGSHSRNVCAHSPGGWGGRSRGQGPSQLAVWWGLSSGPADGRLPAVFTWSPLDVHGERGGKLSGVWGPTLVPSSKSNRLPSPSTVTLGPGFEFMCLGDIQSVMGLHLRRKVWKQDMHRLEVLDSRWNQGTGLVGWSLILSFLGTSSGDHYTDWFSACCWNIRDCFFSLHFLKSHFTLFQDPCANVTSWKQQTHHF